MKNSNWIVTDIANKTNDIIAHIKSKYERLSEERITAICDVRKLDRNGIFSEWANIPEEYKGVNNKNLGCA